MESIIKWQKGEPKEEGYYLVTLKTPICIIVDVCNYEEYGWSYCGNCKVIAWCKLSDIEPYKEEQPDNWTKFNQGEIVR